MVTVFLYKCFTVRLVVLVLLVQGPFRSGVGKMSGVLAAFSDELTFFSLSWPWGPCPSEDLLHVHKAKLGRDVMCPSTHIVASIFYSAHLGCAHQSKNKKMKLTTDDESRCVEGGSAANPTFDL